MKWTIGKKLLIAFISISLIIVIAVFIGIQRINVIRDSSNAILKGNEVPAINTAMEYHLKLVTSIKILGKYLTLRTGFNEVERKFNNINEDINRITQQVRDLRVKPDIKKAFNDISTKRAFYENIARETMNLHKSSIDNYINAGKGMEEMDNAAGPLLDAAKKARLSIEEYDLLNEEVMMVNDYLITGEENQLEGFYQLAKEVKGLARYGQIAAEHEKVVTLADNTLSFYKKYLDGHNASLSKMKEAETLVADMGNILVKIREIAQESMGTSIKGVDKAVSKATFTLIMTSIVGLMVSIGLGIYLTSRLTSLLKKMIRELTEGSTQIASVSEQISSSSQQLAQGTSEQASSLEETSSSIEEMSSMIKHSADNAGEANQLSSNAMDTAENGAKAVNEMITAMQEINSSSEKISNIIKVIDEIAFQTNLLALNAAVEAARAGEHGKGFAVVAEEVRNLAQRSAAAAKDTAALIEESVKKAREGSTLADRSGGVLKEIVDIVKKVTSLVGEIASASREQADGASQINAAVSQMDKVTQQNASNAEQLASSSEELASQATQVHEIVSKLATEVVGGNGRTNGFHIRGRKLTPTHFPVMKKRSLSDVTRITSNSGNGNDGTKKENEGIRVVNPKDVIPMGDEELAEF